MRSPLRCSGSSEASASIRIWLAGRKAKGRSGYSQESPQFLELSRQSNDLFWGAALNELFKKQAGKPRGIVSHHAEFLNQVVIDAAQA